MPFPVAAGELITAADVNFLNESPSGQIRIGAAKSIANATEAVPDFDTTNWASGITADLTNNRLTIITAGIYSITIYIVWAFNSTGQRFVSVRKNGTTGGYVLRDRRTSVDGGEAAPGTTVLMAANDYLDVTVFQTSGAALNLAECILTATYQRKGP